MRYTILILVALVATGCSPPKIDLNVLKRPSAKVTHVTIVEQTDQGAQVEVTVELRNPNSVPLPLVASQYTVTVDQIAPFSLHDEVHMTLPAGGRQTVTIHAAFAAGGDNLRGRACTVTGTITYRPPGQLRKVLTESYVPLPSVTFRGQGVLE